jgi:hypothetical protein
MRVHNWQPYPSWRALRRGGGVAAALSPAAWRDGCDPAMAPLSSGALLCMTCCHRRRLFGRLPWNHAMQIQSAPCRWPWSPAVRAQTPSGSGPLKQAQVSKQEGRVTVSDRAGCGGCVAHGPCHERLVKKNLPLLLARPAVRARRGR